MQLRTTYAYIGDYTHRLGAAARLLDISENTLKNTLQQSAIEVRRMSHDNPAAPAVRIFDVPTIFKIAAWRRENGPAKGKKRKLPSFIAVEIIKGGTGKSTTAAEVGIHLALQGLKVLLIDLDHQANLTQLMGYEADLEPADAVGQEMSIDGIVQGTFEQFIDLVLAGDREPRVPAEECAGFIKRPFGEHGPAVIPADTFLADVESEIAAYRGNRESVFKDIFQKSREGKIPGFNVDDFDAVIFDCPPSISFTSINAVAMADFIVAPVKMDSFTVKGLSRLVTEINRQRRQDPLYQPELIILPTYYQGGVKRVGRMHDRLQSYKDFLSDISIGQNEDFPKSTEKYLPLSLQKPNCAGAMEYQAFARSLAERIAVRGQKVRGAK